MVAHQEPSLNTMINQAQYAQALHIEAKLLDRHPYNAGERLGKALALVQHGAVGLSATVSTVTSGAKTYQVSAAEGCACEDTRHHGRWCKHALAVRLMQGVARRLGLDGHAEAVPAPGSEGESDNGEVPADFIWEPPADEPFNGFDGLDTAPPPPAVAPPAPTTYGDGYAPSTCCFKGRVGGQEITWTVRGTDAQVEARAPRVLAAMGRLFSAMQQVAPGPPAAAAAPPAPRPPAAAQAAPPPAPAPSRAGMTVSEPPALPEAAEDPYCHTHGVYFERRENDRGHWYSHMLDDGNWCRYRAKSGGK